MNLDFQTRNINTLRSQNMILTLANVILAGALLIAMFAWVNRHDRVVLIPPTLKGQATIDWRKADSGYIKSFGLYYATLMGSITPKNVEFLADQLSSVTAPEIYPEIRRTLLALAQNPQFRTGGSSSAFVAERAIFDVESGLTFVVGDNQVYNISGGVKSNPMVYELDIRIIDGRPVVFRLANYSGNEPRTAQWRRANPQFAQPSQPQNQ